jgi:hypothetical protein
MSHAHQDKEICDRYKENGQEYPRTMLAMLRLDILQRHDKIYPSLHVATHVATPTICSEKLRSAANKMRGIERGKNSSERLQAASVVSRMRYQKRQGHQSSLSLLHAVNRVNKIKYSSMPGMILL